MGLILNIVVCLYLCSGALCADQIPWLPCQFIDENVFLNKDGHTETTLINREALLQFGQKGDSPFNPQAITFLVTGGSRLDLRRYVEWVEAEQLECELRRYSTEGIHIRWPVQGAEEYNRWFTCTLRQSKDLFVVTGFLRQSTDQQPTGQQDYRSWPVIHDREILTTTVAMVIKTRSPSVIVGLRSQQRLHCQFAVDHKGPNVTVEWHFQHRGERTTLFSHNSRTGQTRGSGVGMKSLTGGDVTYTLPFTKMSSEGAYICSVAVNPLFASMDVNLHIQEPPRVSINIASTLVLQEGGEHKIICDAENYYPLDVEIIWYQQDPAASGQRVGAPLPKQLENVLLSSHKHNHDMTFSVAAFFYLQAQLKDSGRQFTCSVSHRSLRVPIKKSFILIVEEPSSWLFNTLVGGTVITLLAIIFVMLSYMNSVRKRSVQKKPY